MSKDKTGTAKNQACSCPFCDEPICPDSEDGQYRCKTEGKLAIHQVDCVGLFCPVPVMRAKGEIDELEDGNLMELIADDPASQEDIPRWAKRAGHLLVMMRQDGEQFHYLIQKRNGEGE